MEDKLNRRAVKLVADIDYLMFLDKDLKLLGYEMSEDDCHAFSIRYGIAEDCIIKSTVPKGTAYTLEVWGVNTTLVFLLNDDGKQGELLTYKPNPFSLAKEMGNTIETALPYDDDTSAKEVKLLPEKVKISNDTSLTWEEIAKMVDRVPYPNWMDECWGTKAWIEVWKNKPSLQTIMLEFSAKKYRDQESQKT